MEPQAHGAGCARVLSGGPGVTGVVRITKAQRQHRIALLLTHHQISSQPQLVELLAADGVHATQATVSRDLEDLGAVKVRVPGGETVYAIPEFEPERVAPADHLRRVLGEWVADVAASVNLVVLRTPPGCAHVVASALDRAGMPEIIGTVAGDDTLLCVAAEDVGGSALARMLRDLAGLEEAR
jgi:transcriptional regulator of arginine metabolism